MDMSVFYQLRGYFVGERRHYTKLTCQGCGRKFIVRHDLAAADLAAELERRIAHAKEHQPCSG